MMKMKKVYDITGAPLIFGLLFWRLSTDFAADDEIISGGNTEQL